MSSYNFINSTALILTLTAVMGLTGCDKPAEPTTEFEPNYVELGRDIATTHCAICHSVDDPGISPHSQAPPLSSVFAVYNPDSLADDFREHLHVGHADMPDYDFTVKQVEGLLAYLESIQETPE